MRLPYFNYYEPATLGEVLSILEELRGAGQVLAGGTDLLPLMKYGLSGPGALVSLKNVGELRGIKRRERELFIGAMTSLADLSASALIRDQFAALHQAVEAVAAPPIWNVATLGGNLRQNTRCLYYNQSRAWRLERPPCFKAGGDRCHVVPRGKKCYSVYCGDLAPALMALGGGLAIQGPTRSRSLPLEDFFTGNGLTPFTLAEDELITGVLLPMPGEGHVSAYAKMRLREALDYPLVSAAFSVTLQGGHRVEKARLVLGAVGPAPRIVATAAFFPDGTVDRIEPDGLRETDASRAPLVDNLALPGSYRKKMLPVMAGKALGKALRSIPGKERP
jgi:4-hydroxybenzoyl-CoA reductase subunit beta